MSTALARVRDRLEATPRALEDDELIRIARGDRGCLGDVVSFVGAIALVSSAILGAMEAISFTWTYVALGVWIGGFVWGTVMQSRSGKLRRAALESGPLVLAVVLRHEDWLTRPGKRAGRVVALFTTDPERRFDRDALEQSAATVEATLLASRGQADGVPLRALLADRDAFGLHPLPAELLAETPLAGLPVFLATLVVHPERLDHGYLGGDDDHEAGQLDLEFDAPKRPPTLVAIADPERAFIEQVPQVHKRAAKPPAS